MLDEMRFGEFITAMRNREKLTLRTFSERISLSAAYVSQMESGKRPAPSQEMQRKMAEILHLNEEERDTLYDYAARTKKKNRIPADIAAYIESDGEILQFLREAKRRGFTGKSLLECIRK